MFVLLYQFTPEGQPGNVEPEKGAYTGNGPFERRLYWRYVGLMGILSCATFTPA